MSAERQCARPGCRNPVVGRKDKRFCSDACRFAGWRDEHLRCPNCGVPIAARIEVKALARGEQKPLKTGRGAGFGAA